MGGLPAGSVRSLRFVSPSRPCGAARRSGGRRPRGQPHGRRRLAAERILSSGSAAADRGRGLSASPSQRGRIRPYHDRGAAASEAASFPTPAFSSSRWESTTVCGASRPRWSNLSNHRGARRRDRRPLCGMEAQEPRLHAEVPSRLHDARERYAFRVCRSSSTLGDPDLNLPDRIHPNAARASSPNACGYSSRCSLRRASR